MDSTAHRNIHTAGVSDLRRTLLSSYWSYDPHVREEGRFKLEPSNKINSPVFVHLL